MKIVFLVILFSFFSIVVTAQNYERNAEVYMASGQYANAIREYAAYIKQYGSKSTIEEQKSLAEKCLNLLNYAEQAENQYDYERALDWYKELYKNHALEKYEIKTIEMQEQIDLLNMEKDREISREYFYKGKECYDSQNYDGAIYNFYIAANKGHVEAMYYLGESCRNKNGWNGVYNSQSGYTHYAHEAYQKAADNNFILALLPLGNYYLTKNRIAEAYKCYVNAALKNDVDAMNMIVDLYKKDIITQNNDVVEVHKLAAHHGNIDAQYQIGVWLHERKQLDEAKVWLNQALSNGHSLAQYALDKVYQDEELIRQRILGDSCFATGDYASAVAYYTFAAKAGDDESYYKAGMCYIKMNKGEAINWLTEAAGVQSVDAMSQLGDCYQYGICTKSNELQAIQWYQKASALGCNYAKQEANKLLVQKQKRENIAKWNREGDLAMTTNSYEVAIGYYQKAAEQGDVYAIEALKNAKEQLAIKQRKDNITKWNEEGDYALASNDYQSAVKLYLQSAELGDADALYKLGQCYMEGKGVEANDSIACAYYEQAGELGHAEAKATLAKYLNGEEIKKYRHAGDSLLNTKDYVGAMAYYKKAIDKGDSESYYNMGLCCFMTGNNQTIDWLSKAAETNHVDAMYQLGECYQYGKYVASNELRAINWYQKATERGHLKAKGELNKLLAIKQQRENIETWRREGDQAFEIGEYEKAIMWYEKAIEQGDVYSADAMAKARAQLEVKKTKENIAMWNRNGDRDKGNSNYLNAINWYEKSAEYDDVYAQRRLGDCYLQMGEKYYSEAFRYYQLAATQGDKEAQYALGQLYIGGKGVSVNERAAFSWYMKAAENNYIEAQYAVGKCYEMGVGIEKNMGNALEWYRRAANAGSVLAKIRIAECYEKGKLGKNNHELAFSWYLDAATDGDAHAQYKVGKYIDYGWETNQSIYNSSKYWYNKSAVQGYSKAEYKLAQINNKEKRQITYNTNRTKLQNAYNTFLDTKEHFYKEHGRIRCGYIGISFALGTGLDIKFSVSRWRYGCFLFNPFELGITLDYSYIYPLYNDYTLSYEPTIGYFIPLTDNHGPYMLVGPAIYCSLDDYAEEIDYDFYCNIQIGYRIYAGDVSTWDFFMKYNGAFTVGVAYEFGSKLD